MSSRAAPSVEARWSESVGLRWNATLAGGMFDPLTRTIPTLSFVRDHSGRLLKDDFPPPQSHTQENVKQWITQHPRFHLHFTPTGSSWLNPVERWFAEITRKRIRGGSISSVAELVQAIDDDVVTNNKYPKSFLWTKTAK